MSKRCSVTLFPLELYLMRGEALEGLTFIPAPQLHKPGLHNQSVLKSTNIKSITSERTELRKGVKRKHMALAEEVLQSEFQVCCGKRKVLARRKRCLPLQTEVYQKLADISNLQLSDCEKSLLGTKNTRKIVSATYKQNNAFTTGKSSCTKQHETGTSQQEGDQNKLSKPRMKSHSEHDANFSKNDNSSKVGTQNKLKENCDNNERVVPAKRRKQLETLVSTEIPEDVPLRSKGVRKKNYQLEVSDISMLEPVKKAKTSKKVFSNKLQDQGEGTTKDRNVNKDYEDKTQTEKMPELPFKQPARETRKIKECMKSKNDLQREAQILRESTQNKIEQVKVTKVDKTRGRPKQNQELTKDITDVSVNMQLRRSTRQRKVNYRYIDDSFVFEESLSYPNKEKKQEKMKGYNNLVTNGRAAKSNVRNISQKEDSEKSIGKKDKQLNEKSKVIKSQVCIKKMSLLKHREPRYGEDKGDDVGNRGKEENTSRNGGEEKQCKESEGESTEETKITSKKTANKSEQQTKRSKKPGKPQSEGSQSTEDCKITARKGTLRYLHQREKYITALAKEAEGGDDDFSDNPFFAKKKFKFINLLPPSHEDTLVIKTPERRVYENRESAVVTPRTTMLGQLQPVTPTTQPYSPCASLDTNTKKEALKQVYMWMKNKGHQPKRSRKVLLDTSRQNIHFTPLELPAVPENRSGNESDTMDDYFEDGDSQ